MTSGAAISREYGVLVPVRESVHLCEYSGGATVRRAIEGLRVRHNENEKQDDRSGPQIEADESVFARGQVAFGHAPVGAMIQRTGVAKRKNKRRPVQKKRPKAPTPGCRALPRPEPTQGPARVFGITGAPRHITIGCAGELCRKQSAHTHKDGNDNSGRDHAAFESEAVAPMLFNQSP